MAGISAEHMFTPSYSANVNTARYRRLHLIALLCHLLLQIMQIIYTHRPECRSLIKTENQDTSAVLIGKAG